MDSNHSNGVGKPFLVVGSVAYDDILTPLHSVKRALGGSAAYAAVAGSYFTSAQLVGVVGKDFASNDRMRLQKHSIDLQGLQEDFSGDTFYWRGRYFEDWNRETLDLHLNVFERFKPILPEIYRNSSYVLLGNIDPELQVHVLEQMNENAFVVADSMNHWIQNKREALLKLLSHLNVFILNDEEARLLTGKKNLDSAGHCLLDMGPKYIIIKKGENGACLLSREGRFLLPAYPLAEVLDPTGAGDSFAGAFLGYLAASNNCEFSNLKHAMVYGTVVASYTVQGFSLSALEKAGFEGIQKRFYELVRFTSL